MRSIPEQLGLIDQQSASRTLRLVTRERGAIDLLALEHHVQGITRVDRSDESALLALSVSGEHHGQLWLAEFALEPDPQRPGRRRLAEEGQVVSVVATGLPHPGGLQACAHLLAVPCEATKGWARIEIFDIAVPTQPRLVDSLTLDNSLHEGVSQLTGSKAGFLLFGALGLNEYLLFVGGRSFAQNEGWFYRYTPRVDPAWTFEGTFAGVPRAASGDSWGPQNCAAFVHCKADQAAYLIMLGVKDDSGSDAYTPRLRVFTLERRPGRPFGLQPQPQPRPQTYALRQAELSGFLGPNSRWGSTAYVDPAGELFCYFTARKARPRPGDHVHVLEICELRGV
jgi:hypothetical protein